MPKKTRRLLFYSFVFLFIIAGLAVVFYSQGWRMVFADYSVKFERTGAVYIQTEPKGVSIKIGQETFGDKSGLIQNGTLINEVLPGNYKVEIQKNNYIAWVKDITVESGLVSEVSKIILVPEKLQKTEVSLNKSTDNFWVNSDKIVFSSRGGKSNTNL